MKNLRNLFAVATLMTILIIGASTVKAGLLVSDFSGDTTQPCTETKNESTKTNWGVIVQGFTGVIVQGFTGVIVQGVFDTETDCGVIIQD